MSLVLVSFSPDFVGIVCDGRTSLRDQAGNLTPLREDYQKAWHLSERIIFASTGSGVVGRTLFLRAKALADSRQDDADLFQALVEFITTELPDIRAKASAFFEETGTAVILSGFDALRRRMRLFVFIANQGKLEVFEESEPGAFAIGNPEATSVAAQICELFKPPVADVVLPFLEHVAISVSARVPWSVNSNLRFGLILPPGTLAPEQKSAFPKLDVFGEPSNRDLAVLADGTTFRRPLYVAPDNTFHVSSGFNNQASLLMGSSNAAHSYTATTTSLSFWWSAFSVPKPDGSFVNIAAQGSSGAPAIVISGLASSTSYYVEGYYTLATNTMHIVLSDVGGGTAKCSQNMLVQTLQGDGQIPIFVNWNLVTPASGSGTGGGGGGTGGTCPADDQIMETLEEGFIPARKIETGMHLRDCTGEWNRVLSAHSVDGFLVYVTISDETYHVDVDHNWLAPDGDAGAPLGAADWIPQYEAAEGDRVQAADGSLLTINSIGEPHRGRYRKIRCERQRMRMGKAVAHNFITS
jgi:hypothetical protein